MRFLSFTALYAIFFEPDVVYSPQKQTHNRCRGKKMESGSAVVGNEERKKYHIYVEEYVLSYLRRESDSLELSEIYFYGTRQENGRKFYVYGAGREKGIAAFAEYEPLSELVCRLTQAGPVFLVREPDGECKITGFQVFYDNNEAMQNYLIEWTGSTGERRTAEKSNGTKMPPASTVFPEEEKKRMPHGAMSIQLCLILVVLVAIVITTTDSYDEMDELNRSAREVFFAIENQEAEVPTNHPAQNMDSGGVVEDQARDEASGGAADNQALDKVPDKADSAGKREIVVERVREMPEDAEQGEEEPAQAADSDGLAEGWAQRTDSEPAEEAADDDGKNDAGKESDAPDLAEEEEGVLKSVQETSDQIDIQEAAKESEEENEEALSRSITRYYEVEQGDTLYTISQKIYGDISRVGKICEVNQISDPDKIRSGQRIILP